MKKLLPTNRTTIQLAIIIFFYLILRIVLMDRALWFDEIFNTFLYLNKFPIVELQSEREMPGELNWETEWKKETAIHPPSLSLFYYNWIRLFGDSELNMHLPPIIAGLIGIIILYFFNNLVFENDISFIATLATVFSAPHIMYSVQAIHAIFEMSIFLVSLLILYKFIISKNKKFFWLLLLSNVLGICIFYHYFFYLAIQTIIFWFLRDRLKIRLPYFILAFLIIVFFIFFIIFNYFKGYYSYTHWFKNDFKRTVQNIIYLPVYFTK